MKAAVCRKYGPPEVVQIEDVSKPKPGDDEVLIRIRATTVTAGDWRIRSLTVPKGFGVIARLIFGVSGPRQPILGSELAGEVEAVGENVVKFRVADEIFAFTGVELGCHAEYRTVPENGRIALKPANLSFEEAASLSFGGTTALHYLRDKGKVQNGEKVLIIGASGAVGSAAVQLAKHFGAFVAGVCSADNLELVKSIGAHLAIDYAKEDFFEHLETYDVILDAVGDATYAKFKHFLKRGGRLLLVAANLPQTISTAFLWKCSNKRVLAGHVNVTVDDLVYLKQLAEEGKFKPLIDSRYPLERIVDAHARVATRRKKGNVVVTVDHGDV